MGVRKSMSICLQLTSYKPFGIKVTAYLCVSWILSVIALLVWPASSADSALNSYVLFALAGVALISFFIHAMQKTDFAIAIFATLVQAILAGVIVLSVILWMMIRGNRKRVVIR